MVIDMKKKNSKISLTLIIIILISFIILVYYITRQVNNYQPVSYDQPTPAKTQASNQIYKSKNLKFTINVPSNFQTEDTGIVVTLFKNKEKIDIIRNGTNYSNLEDYIRYFDSKRTLNSYEIRKLIINGNEARSRVITFPQEKVTQKSYYIYINNSVYILSTRSQSLYSDLDQIAQSFCYEP